MISLIISIANKTKKKSYLKKINNIYIKKNDRNKVFVQIYTLLLVSWRSELAGGLNVGYLIVSCCAGNQRLA